MSPIAEKRAEEQLLSAVGINLGSRRSLAGCVYRFYPNTGEPLRIDGNITGVTINSLDAIWLEVSPRAFPREHRLNPSSSRLIETWYSIQAIVYRPGKGWAVLWNNDEKKRPIHTTETNDETHLLSGSLEVCP